MTQQVLFVDRTDTIRARLACGIFEVSGKLAGQFMWRELKSHRSCQRTFARKRACTCTCTCALLPLQLLPMQCLPGKAACCRPAWMGVRKACWTWHGTCHTAIPLLNCSTISCRFCLSLQHVAEWNGFGRVLCVWSSGVQAAAAHGIENVGKLAALASYADKLAILPRYFARVPAQFERYAASWECVTRAYVQHMRHMQHMQHMQRWHRHVLHMICMHEVSTSDRDRVRKNAHTASHDGPRR